MQRGVKLRVCVHGHSGKEAESALSAQSFVARWWPSGCTQPVRLLNPDIWRTRPGKLKGLGSRDPNLGTVDTRVSGVMVAQILRLDYTVLTAPACEAVAAHDCGPTDANHFHQALSAREQGGRGKDRLTGLHLPWMEGSLAAPAADAATRITRALSLRLRLHHVWVCDSQSVTDDSASPCDSV
eukprot:1161522-Pelagomonas_calceolata.AAC.3